MKTLIVDNKFNNKKLLSYLSYSFPNVSQNIFYKALRKKDIRINDVKVSENALLHEGDEIKLYILDKYFENTKIETVYEDENILVVYKPKGLEVASENSLTSILQAQYKSSNIFPCHRLDRNTEGLVLFAKSDEALNILLNKFKNQEITKFYKCRVYGILNKKQDTLEAYLFKDSKKSLVYVSDTCKKGYRKIITEYKVLEENKSDKTSTLEVILHTRKNSPNTSTFSAYRSSNYRRPENMAIIK